MSPNPESLVLSHLLSIFLHLPSSSLHGGCTCFFPASCRYFHIFPKHKDIYIISYSSHARTPELMH